MTLGASDVTIVLPVWDRYVGVLREAIESVLSQSPQPKVIVVDNASAVPIQVPDRVAVVSSPVRLSVGGARNLGLAHVDTAFVLFWDADDLMLPDTIRDLRNRIADGREIVLVATAIRDAASGAPHHWPRRWTAPLLGLGDATAALHSISALFPTTGALIRTDVARDAGGFANVDGGDDWVFGVSLAMRGRISLAWTPGRLYRRAHGSISTTWTSHRTFSNHAHHVRERIRVDPVTPGWLRRALPLVHAAQMFVVHVLAPLSRQMPRRRREASVTRLASPLP